jgi:hypothetical protein
MNFHTNNFLRVFRPTVRFFQRIFSPQLFTPFLMMLWVASFAQTGQSPEEILYRSANHYNVNKYQFDERYEYKVLSSGFSQESVAKIPFSDTRILKIDLVYTTFSEAANFDQKQLDLARLSKLAEINPGVVSTQFIDWNIIGQTGCNSSAECLDFFHGFVVYYEPYYTKDDTKEEIDSIKQDLARLQYTIESKKDLLKIEYERIPCEYPDSYYSEEFISKKLEEMYDCAYKFKGRVFFEVSMDYHGRPQDVLIKGTLFPCKEILAARLKRIFKWKGGLKIGEMEFDLIAKGYVSFPLNKESVHITKYEIRKELVEEYDMLQQYSQCVAYETDTSFAEIIPVVEKRVVSEVIYRHNWKPELIVADVTASMYPYTADLLKWIKLNTIEPTDFVFFNDGDDKPTSKKYIGNTGGLYHVFSSDYRKVRYRMFEAMMAGGGGDLPENNIEALLYGVEQADPQGEVVMLADNFSFPRDTELLAKYQDNLKIVLCRTDQGINTKYLDLAKKYGFSVHTQNTDIIDFSQNELIIEGKTYRFYRGKYNYVFKI